jgi:predicted  nucleic acid-binding Zn-ribbon protein
MASFIFCRKCGLFWPGSVDDYRECKDCGSNNLKQVDSEWLYTSETPES